MEPHKRRHEDPTLIGNGPAIKDPSSAGSSGSPPAAGSVPVGGGSAAAASPAAQSSILAPGAILAGRYEILELLGQGGMGAVYKALDRELDRPVALKVILPELSSNPAMAQRFKQELLLARKVTHKNVIRIYDIGEAAGLKFITMDFVEGQTMRDVLHARGKLSAEETIKFSKQICQALEAAHGEGVIHRDLKPANIMVESSGRVLVMDFGLARNQDTDATVTGGLVGTLEYMSPEQARSEALDARSDLYALGLIMYEMLTSTTPFKAESALAGLFKRAQSRPDPPSSLEHSIPQPLNAIVTRCLEPERNRRYRTASEIIADLELLQREPRRARLLGMARNMGQWSLKVALIVAALAIIFVGVRYFSSRLQLRNTAAPAPVSVLIADFKNNSSEQVFEGSLETVLKVGLEGAPFITTYDRGNARKVLSRVKEGAADLGLDNARLVAQREGVNVVIAGDISRSGNRYKITAIAKDAITGKKIGGDTQEADRDEVLRAVNKLVARLRADLGDTTPQSVQLAAAETYTTRSLDAAHEYGIAQVAQFGGNYDEAIQHSLKALEFDPELGRAYVVLAVVYNNMKQSQQADKYFQLALSKLDSMSDREKYRTRSQYYLVTRKPEKAFEELQQLVARYPSDNTGVANLALAYFYRRDMAKALEEGKRAVQMYPKNTIQRNNVGLFAMYAGDFEAAIREQRAVLEMNPKFVLGYVGIALPQLGQGHPEEAANTYQQLEKIGPDGASAASAGLADLALYQGRISDAISILETGIKQDLANKNPDGAAAKTAVLSQAYVLSGNSKQAVTVANSLASSHQLPIQFWAARAYIAAKQDAKAESIAKELSTRLEADPQAYGKLIEGEIQLSHGKTQQALRLFLESQKLADTWMGHFDAGREYVEAGAYPEAGTELDTCLKRRGEATALFLDESPTYYLFPAVYYYLGRAQQGLKSPAAAESYKNFISTKSSDQDPRLADARRRAGS